MAKGCYSVVQYCPDRFRAEAINVGLVLICLEPHQVRVRMADDLKRARKLFHFSKSDLRLAMQGLQSRIDILSSQFRTAEDLSGFAATRANDLRLTEPRLAKIDDFDADFSRLYSDLVEDRSTALRAEQSPAEVLPPELNEVFYRLQLDNRIWHPGVIPVPVYRRKLEIPYAYRNGAVNLMKPHVFPANKRAESQAAELAINGDLIQRHLTNEPHKLIVISTQETPEQAREINEHVEPLFREYKVRLVRSHDVADFAAEVERSAHK
jgi:hypothetical protein